MIRRRALQHLLEYERRDEGEFLTVSVYTSDYKFTGTAKSGGEVHEREPGEPKSMLLVESFQTPRGVTIERPKSIMGVISVTPTAGRRSAPEARNTRIGVRRSDLMSERGYNSGKPGHHKGHLMALELGGPDVPFNIVPQHANWQSNGPWRKMEEELCEQARSLDDGEFLFMHVDVIYPEVDQGSLSSHRLTTPHGFVVHTCVVDVNLEPLEGATMQCRFSEEQAPDMTDDKMDLRLFNDVDATEYVFAEEEIGETLARVREMIEVNEDSIAECFDYYGSEERQELMAIKSEHSQLCQALDEPNDEDSLRRIKRKSVELVRRTNMLVEYTEAQRKSDGDYLPSEESDGDDHMECGEDRDGGIEAMNVDIQMGSKGNPEFSPAYTHSPHRPDYAARGLSIDEDEATGKAIESLSYYKDAHPSPSHGPGI